MMVSVMSEIRLITLDPGHFHAALVQKEMYPGVSKRTHVYAPLGPELLEHLARIWRFNSRREEPTAWELEVHCGPEFLADMVRDRPGDVVVLAGRNRHKIDLIQASIAAGLNVLADKPWIIRSQDLEKLERCLDTAASRGLVAYDIMTERYEVTSLLQRELVNDPEVFGEIAAGAVDEPAIFMKSVHHIMKLVAGAPLTRPAWFFDIEQQGEGLADVGPHLADLVQWTLFPGRGVEYRSEIEVHGATRWPTVITEEEFRRVTGGGFPEYLAGAVRNGKLEYYCNNRVWYSIRGVHVRLEALWNYQAPEGAGDTHHAVYRGTKSRVEVRQGAEEGYRPELYVAPEGGGGFQACRAAVSARLEKIRRQYPGTAVAERDRQLQILIPEALRVGHEAHFAQVARQFFAYLRGEERVPGWERPNMLAKYYVTTKGVEVSRGVTGSG